MRAAPPVSVRCTGGLAWRSVQTLLPAAAAGVLVVWASTLGAPRAQPATSLVFALAASAAVLAGLVAWRRSAQPSTLLVWDGQQWLADTVPVAPAVMMDLGGWLLLRLRGCAGRSGWLAVSASDAGAALHALRAALYARPTAAQAHNGSRHV